MFLSEVPPPPKKEEVKTHLHKKGFSHNLIYKDIIPPFDDLL